MTVVELKKKEFKRTAKSNMIASLRLEGVSVIGLSNKKAVSELKKKYARQVRS